MERSCVMVSPAARRKRSSVRGTVRCCSRRVLVRESTAEATALLREEDTRRRFTKVNVRE